MIKRFISTINFITSDKIFDCFEELKNINLNLLESNKNNLPIKGYTNRLISFFFHMLSSNFKSLNHGVNSENIILLSNSSREYDACKFIIESDNKIRCIILGNYPYKLTFHYYIIGFLFSPLLVFTLIRTDKKNKKIAPYCIDQFLLCIGTYFIYQKLINSKHTKGIILSNHLSPIVRTAIYIARSKNIKLVYIEHVQYIKKWPPVDCDYLLLSGLNSANKVIKQNKKYFNKIYLIGSPKCDILSLKTNCKNIAICITPEDNINKVVGLIKFLCKRYQYKIIIRPHPSLRKNMYYNKIKQLNVVINYPHLNTIESFLDKCEVLITNESGIYFEAGYANKLVIRYMFSNDPIDIYSIDNNFQFGYIKNTSELIEIIDNHINFPSDSRNLFKDYFVNIDSKYDKNATALALSVLKEIGLYNSQEFKFSSVNYKRTLHNIYLPE